MNDTVFIGLAILVVLISVYNAISLKDYRKDKEYVDTYGRFLRDEENAYEQINEYVKRNASDPQFSNKGRVLKIYGDLECDIYDRDNVYALDLKPIFYKKDKFNLKKTLINSDTFIWLVLDIVKAGSKSMMDVVDHIDRKVTALQPDLNKLVEFNLCKAAYEVIRERRGDGITFLKNLLAGEYEGLTYDKRLIGVYKNIAASLLAYSGEKIEETDAAQLETFAHKLVGHRLLKDLGLLDQYLKEEAR